jgi:hypothetical protein
MHLKEIYVIFILLFMLFDSGILLIIDLDKKKRGKGGGGSPHKGYKIVSLIIN